MRISYSPNWNNKHLHVLFALNKIQKICDWIMFFRVLRTVYHPNLYPYGTHKIFYIFWNGLSILNWNIAIFSKDFSVLVFLIHFQVWYRLSEILERDFDANFWCTKCILDYLYDVVKDNVKDDKIIFFSIIILNNEICFYCFKKLNSKTNEFINILFIFFFKDAAVQIKYSSENNFCLGKSILHALL